MVPCSGTIVEMWCATKCRNGMTSRSTAMISLLSDSGDNSPVHLTAPNRNPNSSSRFSRPQSGSLGTLRPSHVLRCGTNPVSTFFLVLLFGPNIACHFFFNVSREVSQIRLQDTLQWKASN